MRTSRSRHRSRRTLPPLRPRRPESSGRSYSSPSQRPPPRGQRREEVKLTPTELGVVEVLVRHQEKLISQTRLLKEVRGPQYGEETNYLRVLIAQVRRKLELQPSNPCYFLTERSMGYRFQIPGDEDSQ
ncbi:MAG: winged helix-turn-helix domain-containing protein [Acidimicrobiia bacterium]